MGEQFNTRMTAIEADVASLTDLEAQEDADHAASIAKVAELTAKIAELEARETLSAEDVTRLDALKVNLANIKAGAQAAVAEGRRKK